MQTEDFGDRGVKVYSEWITCPIDARHDAHLIVWADGKNADFHCDECGERDGVREQEFQPERDQDKFDKYLNGGRR